MQSITALQRVILVLLTVIGLSIPLWAKPGKSAPNEEKLSQSDLPQAVIATIQSTFPGATITQVTKETENSVQVYDVETRDGSIERDLLLKLDGTLLEVGEHISVSQLPAAVTEAALKAFPRGSITDAELKTSYGVQRYDVTIASDGKKCELFISPAGSLLNSGEDDEGDEDEQGDDD